MYVSPDKLSTSGKSAIEALFSLAETQMKAIESVARLNLGTAREGLEYGSGHVKALFDAKDPQEMAKLNLAYAQPALTKAATYAKSLYDVTAETQALVSKLIEANVDEIGKSLTGLVDNLSKNAPVGSEPAVGALKAWVAAFSTAYDTVSRTTRQAAEAIEANFNAVTETATPGKSRKAAA